MREGKYDKKYDSIFLQDVDFTHLIDPHELVSIVTLLDELGTASLQEMIEVLENYFVVGSPQNCLNVCLLRGVVLSKC